MTGGERLGFQTPVEGNSDFMRIIYSSEPLDYRETSSSELRTDLLDTV